MLIVNHALFFADLQLRSANPEVGILPKYQAVIFDEAHTLEDVAAEHLGLSIDRAARPTSCSIGSTTSGAAKRSAC